MTFPPVDDKEWNKLRERLEKDVEKAIEAWWVGTGKPRSVEFVMVREDVRLKVTIRQQTKGEL